MSMANIPTAVSGGRAMVTTIHHGDGPIPLWSWAWNIAPRSGILERQCIRRFLRHLILSQKEGACMMPRFQMSVKSSAAPANPAAGICRVMLLAAKWRAILSTSGLKEVLPQCKCMQQQIERTGQPQFTSRSSTPRPPTDLWNTVFVAGQSSPKAVRCARFVSVAGLNFNLHETKSDFDLHESKSDF